MSLSNCVTIAQQWVNRPSVRMSRWWICWMSLLMVVGSGGGPFVMCFLMASGVLLVARSKQVSSWHSSSCWIVKVHRLTARMLMPWWHIL